MATNSGETLSEVTVFLDGDDLYVRGPVGAIDVVLDELLGPSETQDRGKLLGQATDSGAIGTTVAALNATTEQLFRPTAASVAKLRDLGAQLDGTGALRGYVRDGAGQFAGDLAFDAVSFGAEQALAMQTAAVSLALRSAIAEVGAAVEAVDEKVSDIQKRVRADEIGEVIGTYRFLQRLVDKTRERGYLLEPDWDQAAGTRRDLYVALERLRAYVQESVNDIDYQASLPKREEAIKRVASPKGVAGSLQLILIAEQSLHLMEYLRLERIRTTHPDEVSSALAEARASLAEQRQRDAELVALASNRIHDCMQIDPLEVHRILSIPSMRRSATKALETIESFAEAARAELPDLDREIRRPQLSETKAEVQRLAVSAKDEAVQVSKTVGRFGSDGVRQLSAKVLRKSQDENN